MKNIVLFTVSYPYGKREQFLETEILYLSKHFSTITIIPTYIQGLKRDLPENVSVDDGFASNNSNFLFFLRSLYSVYFYKELIERPSIFFSYKKLIKLSSFVGKGVCLYNYIKDVYDDKNLFYSYWFNGSVFGSYLYNQDTNIHYLSRAHGSDLYLDVNEGYLPLRATILKTINKVWCVSHDGAQYLQDLYKIEKKKVEVARLGTLEQYIQTQSSSDGTFRLVSCSHLTPIKRIEMLVEVLILLAQRNVNKQIEWTHLGGGPLYQKIKSLCQSYDNINLSCRFMGNMSNQKVFEYYKTNPVDLFINVSSSEGLPVSFMEVFSCGIPVLSIDNGGISEIVDNQNGILLSKDTTVESLVTNLHYCLNHKAVLESKKVHARQTWEKSYNAEINYTNFCRVLDD